eukprot:906374-Pyramimonas_sp.AAC.1
MDYRRAFWCQVWESVDGSSLISGALGALRPRASESIGALGPWGPVDVQGAARCFSAPTAVGVGSWAPRALMDLPRDAVLGHAHLLNQREALLSWPSQVHLSVIALSQEIECHRPICRCPTIYG